MNQIIKISYKVGGGNIEGYFIETKKGLVAINLRQEEFVCIPKENISSIKEVSVNKITGKIE